MLRSVMKTWKKWTTRVGFRERMGEFKFVFRSRPVTLEDKGAEESDVSHKY